MATLREWLRRLYGTFRPNRNDDDLERELRLHVELAAEDARRQGHSPAESHRAASIRSGGPAQTLEQLRDQRGLRWLDDLTRDVRFGVRLLVRSPVFTVFAVASLTAGIGATSALFSLFDGIVLQKLPVSHPEQLVVASFGGTSGASGPSGNPFNYSLPYPQFSAIVARNTTLSGLFATGPFGRVNVDVRGESGLAEGTMVSGDYYRVLGLAPAAGRLIQPADDRPGQVLAVLSHAYWQRRFGGRPDIVGTGITLNAVPFTIIGVEPAGFLGTEVGSPYDISVPLRTRDMLVGGAPLWDSAFSTWIYVMGRLKPGVTLEQAQADAKTIFAQVSQDAAKSPSDVRLATSNQLRFEPAAAGSFSDLRNAHERWLRLTLMALAAVLLLASLNLATLLLARSDSRQREISTRLALGAGRTRIIRQLLTESLMLAALGGTLGFMLGSWGSQVVLRMATAGTERLTIELAPNLRLTLFTITVSTTMCLLFGLLPALRASRARQTTPARQIGTAPRRLVDRVLVATQVALSLVLLVGTGLFLRTLGQLWAQDPGYNRQNVLMFSVNARIAGNRGQDIPLTYKRVLDALHTIPHAQMVTASAVRPVSDSYYFVSSVSQVGDERLSDDRRIRVAFNTVAPGYFAALGTPLAAGRDFDERDSQDAPKVVIISERLALHFKGSPVGQMIVTGRGPREVVGIASDVRYANVKDAPREVVYFPLLQAQPAEFSFAPTFEIRYRANAGDLLPSIREALGQVDPRLQMFGVKTLEEQTRDSLSRERLLALLTSYVGGFATVLACIGLYGLTSFGVTRRTAEIGLRMALGAQATSVRWMVVREAALTVGIGTIAGLLGTLATERFVRSQLFGVQPRDPLVLISATLVLVAASLIAAYVPARRASKLDPMQALRHS